MSRSTGKLIREGLIWSTLGVLLSAALVAAVGCLAYRKSVTLEMSWKRGDYHYGPNFIHLESACLSNPVPGCFCSLDITDTSKEFADYVESFGRNGVPVKFYVDYDRNHEVVGAILEGVAEWPEERFHIKERSLGTGFRMLPNKRPSGGHLNNPADCFPKSVK